MGCSYAQRSFRVMAAFVAKPRRSRSATRAGDLAGGSVRTPQSQAAAGVVPGPPARTVTHGDDRTARGADARGTRSVWSRGGTRILVCHRRPLVPGSASMTVGCGSPNGENYPAPYRSGVWRGQYVEACATRHGWLGERVRMR